MPEWVVPAFMAAMACLSPLLAWWGSSRYFAGSMQAQQEAASAWRKDAERRLAEIESILRANSYSAMLVRMDRAEKDLDDLRRWKHQVDPYIKRRIDP